MDKSVYLCASDLTRPRICFSFVASETTLYVNWKYVTRVYLLMHALFNMYEV